ncbi:oxygen-independent coproporphyrinogen III oxidase [Chitinimonas koreensis]|uniref:oxygen-independent coproporphyrinogen III oxidase n=1 Tax=Chitinimonas koreensis TaxID=356302 RepID=UPI00040DF3F6|nr:oxygen-independent coproporphyrinogen III oxidase [Chitinimonas koreensis]QNM94729.1 oxygen-independent coproporphyrinogen III oxidase [Chitinimonas koreensis]
MQIPFNDDPTALEFDPELVRRHDGPGPRYTSYPTADRFVEEFDEARYRCAVDARRMAGAGRPLSLYVHLPFCGTACYYCACNKIVTEDRGQADAYLDALEQEIVMQARLFGREAPVTQLHLGGGTPTFLTDAQLERLMRMLTVAFSIAPDAERSVEIDPRQLGEHTLALLAGHGFKRMSIGVQDLDPAVQAAINRVQPAGQTAAVLDAGRALGYRSINLDLIYGLPLQTPDSLAVTLEQVKAWRPARIALYSYAHLPERFKPQRRIDATAMPSAETKLAMLRLAVETLLAAGYLYIGMDHFALPDDELAVALRQGRLHRNFQGYSTQAECDLVGLGVSAIGKVGGVYAQNHRVLDDYYDAVGQGRLPIARGLALGADDLLRRAVIQALLCQSELVIEPFETSWMIDFRSYFVAEWPQLEALAQDGLVALGPDRIRVTARGRLLARVVAMCFDRYLRETRMAARYSRVI